MSEENMYKPDHGGNGWRMKAFIISMLNNQQSTVSTRKLLHSIKTTKSAIQPFVMPATTPDTIDQDIKDYFDREYQKDLYDSKGNLRWTWPTHPSQDGIDFSTGLYKRAYAAADWRKVASCTISHMRLWQHCIDIDEPIMILEHDAFFVGRFNYRLIVEAGQDTKEHSIDRQNSPKSQQWTGGICGINSPQGTTRKANVFYNKIKVALTTGGESIGENGEEKTHGLTTVPYVDEIGDTPLPNGLAGNSAYIIKPWAAKKLLEKTQEIGLWPNDALMCRQFFPWLQVYFPFFTRVQNTPSTTTK